MKLLASTAKKCLLRLSNSTVHSENADLALLSVLGLTRAAAGLASIEIEGTNTAPAADAAEDMQATSDATRSPDEDLFGSMDDALFMNIDLDVVGEQGSRDLSMRPSNESVDRHGKAFKELWIILIDMIKSTKVI